MFANTDAWGGADWSAAQKLQWTTVRLMRTEDVNFQLLGSLSVSGETKLLQPGDPHYGCPTACTDGINDYWNEEFVQSLSPQELLFVRMHENVHKLEKDLLQMERYWKIDFMLSNMACDYHNNLLIVYMDPILVAKRQDDPTCRGPGKYLSIPEGCLIDEQFLGMTKPEIFHQLWEENNEEGEENGGAQKSTENSEESEGTDGTDATEEGATEEKKHKYSKKIKERAEGWEDEHRWQELTQEEKKEYDDEMRQRTIQAREATKRLGGDVSTDLAAKHVAVETPWQEILAEFWKQSTVKGESHTSFRRFNKRRLAEDEYMPTYVNEEMGNVAVLKDVSGSVSLEGSAIAMSEIQSLALENNPTNVHVLYWGSSVERVETYSPVDYDTLVESAHPPRGGGTSPECALQYIIDKQQEGEYNRLDCVIILTDGEIWGDYGDWSQLGIPVVWGLIRNDRGHRCDFEPDYGTKIIIK